MDEEQTTKFLSAHDANQLLSSMDPNPITRWLRKNNITQKELSNRTGLSPQQINHLCKGKHKNLKIENVRRICEATGIQLHELANFLLTK